jgi:hypothetical protein
VIAVQIPDLRKETFKLDPEMEPQSERSADGRRQMDTDAHGQLKSYNDFTIHPLSERQIFHKSLIISVYPCCSVVHIPLRVQTETGGAGTVKGRFSQGHGHVIQQQVTGAERNPRREDPGGHLRRDRDGIRDLRQRNPECLIPPDCDPLPACASS